MAPPRSPYRTDRRHHARPPCVVEGLEARALLSVVPGGIVQTTYVAGLAEPTAMAFAPDGRLFVSEKAGTLRVVRDGALLAAPFVTLPADTLGERGLLGVAFDPDFAANHYVYVYWTAPAPAIHNRVSRFTADGDVAAPGSEVDLLDLPDLGPGNHNGGAIHFGPDGKLYVGVGENGTAANSQSLDTTLGKILRINPDGTAPTDNPFYDVTTGINRDIWAMGLRNPFTFNFQPGTGRLFIDDVGQVTWEEVDEGAAGANYGWPTTEGPTTDPRFRGPLYAYEHGANDVDGGAITGGTFYTPPAGASAALPTAYDGAYFYADYSVGYIKSLDLSGGGTPTAARFATGLAGTVDLAVGPDGALYSVNDADGTIARFAPAVSTTPGATAPDLIGSIAGVPTKPVPGGAPGTATVRLQNVGGTVASGRVEVKLYLSADPALDDQDASLGTVTSKVAIKPGRSKNVKFKFAYPAAATGNYYLLAAIDTSAAVSEGNESNNVAQSETTAALVPPLPDLSLTFAAAPATVTRGRRTSVAVKVLNTGNVATSGGVAVTLYSATDSTGAAGATPLATVSKKLNVKPTRSKTVRLSFVIPAGATPGTLFFAAAVDPAGLIAELNEADNFTAAATPFELR